MRRADRLFQLVQILRRGGVVTAAALARELEVSLRTIYRDIGDLVGSGVPVEGEAGVGYQLAEDFDLPPLMFDEEEVRALVLGARMVQAWGDSALARSARAVLDKVDSVLPERLRGRLEDVELFVPLDLPRQTRLHVERFRRGIDEHRKLRFRYTDRNDEPTQRIVRPLCLVFWGTTWTASAWCELRDDFRHFRPDRMDEVELLDETFEDRPGQDLQTLLARIKEAERRKKEGERR